MGIREKMNENPGVTTGVTIAIVLLAIIFIVWEVWPSSPGSAPTQAYFSDDDGKTWFADSATKIPPFDHNGKEAVRAAVFSCGNGTKFVAFLEKNTPEVKKMLEHPAPAGSGSPMALGMAGTLIKKPGAGNKWLSAHDKTYYETRGQVKCPDGSTDVTEVTP